MTTTAKSSRPKPTRPAPPPSPSAPEGPPVTVGDLLDRLGGIPARRVLLHPTPGTATEADLLKVLDGNERLCELVEGSLVEKPMGLEESMIAMLIGAEILMFAQRRRLGRISGGDGPYRLFGGLVRLPDVAYISYDRLPGRKLPKDPIPNLVPDLAVEVLSKSNTPKEMKRKLEEYFAAGVRLVWIIDPRKKTVRVHTAIDRSTLLREGETLDGGDVLPGFQLPLARIFEPEEEAR